MQSRLGWSEACWEGPMQEGGGPLGPVWTLFWTEGLQLRGLFIFESGTDIRKLMF